MMKHTPPTKRIWTVPRIIGAAQMNQAEGQFSQFSTDGVQNFGPAS